MNEAEKAYQYFVIAIPENAEQAKAYFWARKALQFTLATPNQWVSVKDRLPNKPGHYLVCTSINYWHGGCLDVNQEHKYHDSGTPVGYDGTTMSVLDCYYDITGDWNRVCNKHVTHWMPLPEPPDNRPPKREKNDD